MTELEKLQKRLEDLYMLRKQIEISDDFAYTNGKIKQIDYEIHYLDDRIAELINNKGEK